MKPMVSVPLADAEKMRRLGRWLFLAVVLVFLFVVPLLNLGVLGLAVLSWFNLGIVVYLLLFFWLTRRLARRYDPIVMADFHECCVIFRYRLGKILSYDYPDIDSILVAYAGKKVASYDALQITITLTGGAEEKIVCSNTPGERVEQAAEILRDRVAAVTGKRPGDFQSDRRQRLDRRLRLMKRARFFQIVFSLIWFFVLIWTEHSAYYERKIIARGVETTGSAISSYITSGTRVVNYAFRDSEGKQFSGSGAISLSDWRGVSVDGNIAVLYLPDMPEKNLPAQVITDTFTRVWAWLCAVLLWTLLYIAIRRRAVEYARGRLLYVRTDVPLEEQLEQRGIITSPRSGTDV